MSNIGKVVLAVALAAFAVPSFAQKGPGPANKGKQPMINEDQRAQRMIFNPEKLKKRLDLTDDQVSKIEEINKKYFAEHKSIIDKIRPKSQDLRKYLKEDTIDMAKVKGLMTEISELQVESHMLMVKQYVEIESVLTPEQKVKARKAKQQLIDKGPGFGREAKK